MKDWSRLVVEGDPTLVQHVYSYRFRVPDESIDALGHVNNIEYVQWLQDAALRHSDHVGLTWERCRRIGAAFVIRKQVIEYLRPVGKGETLAVRTWSQTMDSISAVRSTRIVNSAGDPVLSAETTWVFVSLATMRPTKISAEVRDMFHARETEETAIPG
jgi:acyl-CoA thioester hydrolase